MTIQQEISSYKALIPETLTIVCCANDKFATGLILAMASCLAQSSGRFHYDLVVLDGGLTEQSKSKLQQVLTRISKRVGTSFTLSYVMPEPDMVAQLPQRAGTWMTYARFLLAELLSVDKVIYLDSDILCFRGVEEFYAAWDGKAAIVAARDPKQTLNKDWPDTTTQAPKDKMYFNAGLILLNLNWMREHVNLSLVKACVDRFGMKKLKHADQTILNYFVARDTVIEIPRENNWVLATEYAVQLSSKWRSLNIHYIGRIKPWLRDHTEARRHMAEVLYYRASQVYQVGEVTERKVDKKDLNKIKQKAFYYRLVKPKRAKIYQAVLRSLKEVEMLEKALTENDFYSVIKD